MNENSKRRENAQENEKLRGQVNKGGNEKFDSKVARYLSKITSLNQSPAKFRGGKTRKQKEEKGVKIRARRVVEIDLYQRRELIAIFERELKMS